MLLSCVHLLFFGLTATWAFQLHVNRPKKNLTWFQNRYFQNQWYQRLRFTTPPVPGVTPDPTETRIVYPCFCYKPNMEGKLRPYEKTMIEPKDLFFLN